MTVRATIDVHFADFFGVDPATLEEHGAFNVSLINDLPLFIDPFLLFTSPKHAYRRLHDSIILYLRFLRDKSLGGAIRGGLLKEWFTFPEIRQNWLGYSWEGNAGRGLGIDFAEALHKNLGSIFTNFGAEQISRGSHLEKLCLIEEGVGRDSISDFSTNLLKDYLLSYSEGYARRYLSKDFRRLVVVPKGRFDYKTETWQAVECELPFHPYHNDYVILTPKDILTKDETWISRRDLFEGFDQIIQSLPNAQLRDRLNNYFLRVLPEKPKQDELEKAIARAIREFPEVIEYYIRNKEDNGEQALANSNLQVRSTETQFVKQLHEFIQILFANTSFYQLRGNTHEEARRRVMFLKDVIENKGGHKIFYGTQGPIRSEADLHVLFRLTWFGTISDVTREANDGRGPADYKISRGAFDKTIVEFKLASNRKLKQNLANQVEVYQKASDAEKSLTVIVYFTEGEYTRVDKILGELGLRGNRDVILIDARSDNKPAGSYA